MPVETTYLVSAPRTSELVMWLKCNDVDPYIVPMPSDMFVETDTDGAWWIRHTAYVRARNGSTAYNSATRRYVYEECRAPLLNDPPMHWLTELAGQS